MGTVAKVKTIKKTFTENFANEPKRDRQTGTKIQSDTCTHADTEREKVEREGEKVKREGDKVDRKREGGERGRESEERGK